ncbi:MULTISPECIES: GNAT family protein [unclassified Stenotrophomonas]|uniref:GNAT family N-acetyltransferase n=1 Tax=unclassified Stenotrophomonas TaxID=196198 RepID=UPI0021173A36|nr:MULTISPECIES: GNAT family protein [unclassified Stenotrophomonas]
MHFDSTLQLHSARLVLSPIRASDGTALFAIQSDPTVMRYWNHAAWTELKQAYAQILDDLAAMDEGIQLKLGIREQADGPLLGICVVFGIEEASGRAEIGYNLAPQAQGKGYMHEALQCFVDYLFDDRGLRRLEAEIDPRNAPSAKVLERIGFQREGLLRERWCVGGELSDSALYGLLARERAR